MPIYAIAFFAGVLALQFCAVLPPLEPWWFVPLVPVFIRWPRTRIPLLVVSGFIWAMLRAEVALAPRIDAKLEGKTLWAEGTVLDIPRRLSGGKSRFLFRLERLDSGDGWKAFTARVRLANYAAIEVPQAGERWRLALRLKRPRGFSNPGGFDFERWLFEQRITATGYIRKDPGNLRLQPPRLSWIAAIRIQILQSFERMPRKPEALAMIKALTVGDRGDITQRQWDTLRATGTSHLMAISGLHISLVAGLVFWLANFTWSRSARLTERFASRKAAALAAILAALLYAMLSGFNIPARRAVVMVTAFMLAIVFERYSSLAHALCLALLVTLLIDPVAVLSVGWWLSFQAVAIIAWLISGRHGRRGIAYRWLFMHFVLAVCMFPLLLFSFQQASLVAPLANFLAVPWVGTLVVPLALLGTVASLASDATGQFLLGLSANLLGLVWHWLEWLEKADFSLWHQHQPLAWTLLPALAGLALLFMPRGMPGRWTGLFLLLPLFLVTPDKPGQGEVWVSVLDVGQGLATVVQTRRHTLVYDAGADFGDGFDAGEAVVVPFLRAIGVRSLDALVVSHGDNDHMGGVDSLLAAYPAARIISGTPDKLDTLAVERCTAGDRWLWDGISFTILHPRPGSRTKGNDASCVLLIEAAAGQRVLLTGDIEAASEAALVHGYPGVLSAEVLVAPHHGSATSSSLKFVKAVHPRLVLIPAGYRNRYGFPKQAVVERYAAIGAEIHATGDAGAITVRLGVSRGSRVQVSRHRELRRRYWSP